jgi:hypothetical protein
MPERTEAVDRRPLVRDRSPARGRAAPPVGPDARIFAAGNQAVARLLSRPRVQRWVAFGTGRAPEALFQHEVAAKLDGGTREQINVIRALAADPANGYALLNVDHALDVADVWLTKLHALANDEIEAILATPDPSMKDLGALSMAVRDVHAIDLVREAEEDAPKLAVEEEADDDESEDEKESKSPSPGAASSGMHHFRTGKPVTGVKFHGGQLMDVEENKLASKPKQKKSFGSLGIGEHVMKGHFQEDAALISQAKQKKPCFTWDSHEAMMRAIEAARALFAASDARSSSSVLKEVEVDIPAGAGHGFVVNAEGLWRVEPRRAKIARKQLGDFKTAYGITLVDSMSGFAKAYHSWTAHRK